jgi:hypothetical protein
MSASAAPGNGAKGRRQGIEKTSPTVKVPRRCASWGRKVRSSPFRTHCADLP